MIRGTVHRLSGPWSARPVDQELGRTGAAPELDHSTWPSVDVPGHWARTPELATESGPILYRHRFGNADLGAAGEEDDGTRLWLCFDGIIGSAEVWIDGGYLGDTVGYFAPHRFEITEQVRARSDHAVALDVFCPPGGGRQAGKRDHTSLTGSLQTGSLAPPGNPGGLWRPAHVEATGPVAIRHGRLLCTGADESRATLLIRLVVDSLGHDGVSVSTTVTRNGSVVAESQAEHRLASGENRLEWEVAIENPSLWWPRSLGEQPLYDVDVVVEHDGRRSDGRQWRTGLRTVAKSNFIWRINGQRLFVKGIAYGPPSAALNDVPADRLRDDVALVADTGLDMMRIYAHVTRREVYKAADELGILVWQDLPLIGGYSSKVRRSTKMIVREIVDHLGAHPSVMGWGGHVLPNGDAVELPTSDRQERPRAILRRFARHITPSWNRVVLDSIVGRELKGADPTRPIITRSASLPSPTDPAGSDAFLWFGWRAGLASDFADAVASWPRIGAFPGGIGSQSVAVRAWEVDEPRWETAERRSFDHYLPRGEHRDGESWAKTTRRYQADLLECHIDTLRRLKYAPTGGFCLFTLADIEPEGGFGIVDTDRRPKPAWHRVHAAVRPLVVLLESPPPMVNPGQSVTVAVHAISDLPHELIDVTVTAQLIDGRGAPVVDGAGRIGSTRAWRSSLERDSCRKVADLTFVAPETLGPLDIEVSIHAEHQGEAITSGRIYRTLVVPPTVADPP